MTDSNPQPLPAEKEWILLADDDPAVREIIGGNLKANGYHILNACNGVEAVALYAQYQERITVVITDWSMPVMDGPACIRELRKINPQVKVILISGSFVKTSDQEMEELAVQAIMTKPFARTDLLQALQEDDGSSALGIGEKHEPFAQ